MYNKIRDKFLTEAMGECWHDFTIRRHAIFTSWLVCRCGATDDEANTDFSSWEGFGKIWEWSQKQEWFPELIRQTCYYEMCRNEFSKGNDSIIHPDRFADAVFCYMAE